MAGDCHGRVLQRHMHALNKADEGKPCRPVSQGRLPGVCETHTHSQNGTIECGSPDRTGRGTMPQCRHTEPSNTNIDRQRLRCRQQVRAQHGTQAAHCWQPLRTSRDRQCLRCRQQVRAQHGTQAGTTCRYLGRAGGLCFFNVTRRTPAHTEAACTSTQIHNIHARQWAMQGVTEQHITCGACGCLGSSGRPRHNSALFNHTNTTHARRDSAGLTHTHAYSCRVTTCLLY